MNQNTVKFMSAAINKYGVNGIVDRKQIQDIVDELNIKYPVQFTTDRFRVGRGKYRLFDYKDVQNNKDTENNETKIENMTNTTNTTNKNDEYVTQMSAQVMVLRAPKLEDESQPSIPEKFEGYVPFGFFSDLKSIIKSKTFYPIFITGMSGNGKTLMVEQICASLKRECVRVNISIETDQTDLLGGPTLINGNVVNRDGPVITAMKRGAILLIDEVDRGSNKLMCLQSILEGKPYYNKNTGEIVNPSPGFNVIATANSKGRGSDEGRYLSQILDDSFLERFPITVEQEYPNSKTELQILKNELEKFNIETNTENEHVDFAKKLVAWSEVIRKTFDDGGVDELISTRRLVHIIKAYSIFKNKMKAIELCVSRFDTETKNSFIDLYTKLDSEAEKPNEETADIANTNQSENDLSIQY